MKLDLAKYEILQIQEALLANKKAANKAETKAMDDHGLGSAEHLAAEAQTERSIRLENALAMAIEDSPIDFPS